MCEYHFRSHKYECPCCGPVAVLLKERSYKKAAQLSKEAKEISKEMAITEKVGVHFHGIYYTLLVKTFFTLLSSRFLIKFFN